jgi:GNAT superfamily N-acetyltransferase
MTPIEYREDRPAPEAYLELYNTTGWNEKYRASAAELARAVANSWHFVAAYEGERLVGIGRVVSDGVLYAMIYDLIVNPDYQGCGIGAEILRRLVEKCRAAGIRDVQLFSAKGKAPFYRKYGFEERPVDAPGMRLRRDEMLGSA